MAERELVERCSRGDRDAQHEVYSQTSARIYRLLLKLTGSPEDAFDLAQETYLRGFSRMEHFNGNCSLATWLYRIAINEAMQFLRRNKMARVKMKSLPAVDGVGLEDERSMARLDVNAALARLGPVDRLVLLLRYNEGLGYRAIAEVVGCAEGTVGSRLTRANERLRQLLGDGYAPPEETMAAKHQRKGDVSRLRAKRKRGRVEWLGSEE